MPSGDEPLREQAVQIVLAMAPLPVDAPTGATRLVDDLGYDSLRLIELSIALQEHFGVTVKADESARADTVADVEALVVELADQLSG